MATFLIICLKRLPICWTTLVDLLAVLLCPMVPNYGGNMCQQLNNLSISFCHRLGFRLPGLPASRFPGFLREGQHHQLLLQLLMLPQTNIFLLVCQRCLEGHPQINFPAEGVAKVSGSFPIYIASWGPLALFSPLRLAVGEKKNFLIKVDCCMSICHLFNSSSKVFHPDHYIATHHAHPVFPALFAISFGNSSGTACASGACSLSLCFRFITYYFRFDTLAQGAWLLELNAVSPFEF